MKLEKFNTTISFECDVDDRTHNCLIKNCEYRHFLYNKCVEIVKSCQENHPEGHIGVDKYALLATIRDYYEVNILNGKRPDYLEDYDYYFRGISECVVDDINRICQRVIHERSLGKSSDIKFRSYNPNNQSFKFKNKLHYEKPKNKNGLYSGSRVMLTDNPHLITIKINNAEGGTLDLRLKEKISYEKIDLNTIKEISFKFHNDKWIVYFHINDPHKLENIHKRVEENFIRKKLCGIDLGEQNPVVLYDGKIVEPPKHLQFPKEKINKLYNRIATLKNVLDKKYNPEKGKCEQSNNYYKVLKKIHRDYNKISNLKKDWHYKLAYWIVTKYETIVVDEFHDFIISKDSEYNSNPRRRMNHSMETKSMGKFMIILRYMAKKYDCSIFIPHTETTNVCSNCGNHNINKLNFTNYNRLNIFKCEYCGKKIDRDENAAINCYNLYKNEKYNVLEYLR